MREPERTRERPHHCHWAGCETAVPPAKWGCFKHWKRLPKALQNMILACYTEGQENNLHLVSDQYLAVGKAAEAFSAAWREVYGSG